MGVTVTSIGVGSLETVPKGMEKTGGTGNQKKNRDHPDHSIVKIGWNTKKRSGDLERLAVIHTPAKYHHLTLVKKKKNL